MTNNPSPQPAERRADWLERAALVLILAAVAILAGKVAFGRVVDWTMANSTDATPRYAGWTNGVISELLPIGVLLFIRHQKRHGRKPGVLAWSALIGAILFSLAAQLAQATPNLAGWIVAAMPSVAFALLSKLVVSMRPAQDAVEVLEGSNESAPTPKSGLAEAWTDVTQPPAHELHQEREPAKGRETDMATEADLEPRTNRRALARSLTSRTSVEKAAQELGAGAMPSAVAARAGVSESTARRYMPRLSTP